MNVLHVKQNTSYFLCSFWLSWFGLGQTLVWTFKLWTACENASHFMDRFCFRYNYLHLYLHDTKNESRSKEARFNNCAN